ncbi:short-chain dehydrogenase/reductase family protein, putative [Talaromyces stipitatus ATCC 10500]|uniref:Short-chain dehydrogenase/reductase family protein, putative n=1 Tax=Talaromyces stipitatus (strain ATCC 10500 / CBS 375.48 / QM 6759 / NRRL 1006) TaxID=441959 RepID=B8MKL0_TALSN|nr:short-chain dehydrogenase/reductase family protein, putative [Talaromyces stipitatus ATCC 10500]EED15365.1 short-chain dehydrogenase/reductase family protein, putative [Talaromyces stipitatus ATCC 10500]
MTSTTPSDPNQPRSTLSQDLQAVLGITAHGLRNPAEVWTAVGPTMNELTWGLMGYGFRPEQDIPDLSGKVIFITGGNTGLGKETILQLARHNPARIYLAARNVQKAENAIRSIKAGLSAAGSAGEVDIRFIQLDLTSFPSIERAAETFIRDNTRLDILVLNAGIMAEAAITTPQGHEIQFGTNHIGHFLLTKLLLPVLLETASPSFSPKNEKRDVRVITLSSLASAHTPHTPEFMDLISTPRRLLDLTTWQRYAISKAANILFAAELARRYPSLTSVSVHPGVVASDLYNGTEATNALAGSILPLGKLLLFRSVRSGTLNQLWAAAGGKKEDLVNGGYYTPVGNRIEGNRFVVDKELAGRLWEWTEREVQRFGL